MEMHITDRVLQKVGVYQRLYTDILDHPVLHAHSQSLGLLLPKALRVEAVLPSSQPGTLNGIVKKNHRII